MRWPPSQAMAAQGLIINGSDQCGAVATVPAAS